MEQKNKEHKVLINEQEISKRIDELAARINSEYKGERLIVISVLKGSFMFMSDLVKRLELDTEIYFMKASSYGGGTKTTGEVKITQDVERSIENENVLVVEDIIDSGYTMEAVLEILKGRKPKSLRLCSCLSKPSRREVDVNIDFLGFEIEDRFVIGYGLDYAEKYRNLPYIGIIE